MYELPLEVPLETPHMRAPGREEVLGYRVVVERPRQAGPDGLHVCTLHPAHGRTPHRYDRRRPVVSQPVYAHRPRR